MKAASLRSLAKELRAELAVLQGEDDATIAAAQFRALGCSVVAGHSARGQPLVVIRADDEAAPGLASSRDALIESLDSRGLGHVLVVVSNVESPSLSPSQVAAREATPSNTRLFP